MALAIDATSKDTNFGEGVTSRTMAHTCTGTNLFLVSFGSVNSGSDIVSGVTYNGVAMTRSVRQLNNSGTFTMYAYYLIAPATGANNIVWSLSSGDIAVCGISLTGANQSAQPDVSGGSNSGGSSGTSYTNTLTTVADNSWHLAAMRQTVGGGITAGSGTAVRVDGVGGASFSVFEDDGGAVTPAGSNTLTGTGTDTDTWFTAGISVAPFVVSTTTRSPSGGAAYGSPMFY